MNSFSPRTFGEIYRTRLSYVLLLAAMCSLLRSVADAQVSPILNSNVEQTAATTSRGKSSNVQSAGPTALPDDFTKLRLERSYSLQFDVFGVSELSQVLTVDDDGDVIVPLVGAIHVAGETLREAERQIAFSLVQHQMLNSPTVSLKLLEFAKQAVTVSGEVQAPGRVQLLAPRSLLDVLALAGGETTAAGGEVELRHRGGNGVEELVRVPYVAGKDPSSAQEVLVYPGDNVYVRRAGVVYILGAVLRPGGYLMVNGGALTVPEAVALALGTTPVASTNQVLIVRKQNGQILKLMTSLKDEQVGRAAAAPLVDGDMLYVPTSKIKAALVNSSAVISAAASAGIIAGVHP